MTDLAATDQLFFDRTDMDATRVETIVQDFRCPAWKTANCTSNTTKARCWASMTAS